MENMRSVLVYMNSFDILTVNISGNVIPSIDHQTFLSFLSKLICHNRPIESGADDQIIIFFHIIPLFCSMISMHQAALHFYL